MEDVKKIRYLVHYQKDGLKDRAAYLDPLPFLEVKKLLFTDDFVGQFQQDTFEMNGILRNKRDNLYDIIVSNYFKKDPYIDDLLQSSELESIQLTLEESFGEIVTLSALEIFGNLITGKKIHVYDDDSAEFRALKEIFFEEPSAENLFQIEKYFMLKNFISERGLHM